MHPCFHLQMADELKLVLLFPHRAVLAPPLQLAPPLHVYSTALLLSLRLR